MATGGHTKHLAYDDALARRIQPKFVEMVDPEVLLMYLPPCLTKADEERIQARQTNDGRSCAAHLMLQLLSRRGNWVPVVKEGLCHKQVRLEHLAQMIDDLQRETPMEVDVDNDDDSMETESEGRSFHDLPGDQMQCFRETVVSLVEQFFTIVVQDPEQVHHLFQSNPIFSLIELSSIALGCLEVHLRMASASSVRVLRELLGGGSLCQLMEHGLLTDNRRQWLSAEAAKCGLKWRQIRLKVSISEEALDQCEAYLMWASESLQARSAGGALLLSRMSTMPEGRGKMYHVTHMPRLLRSFLDWLALHHPHLATTVASQLADKPWETAVGVAMETCRKYFRLDCEQLSDITTTVSTLFVKHCQEGDPPSTGRWGDGEQRLEQVSDTLTLNVQELSPLSPDFIPAIDRLRAAGILVSVTSSSRVDCLKFSNPFLGDQAISHALSTFSSLSNRYLSFALCSGSEHLVLHLLTSVDVSASPFMPLLLEVLSTCDTSHPAVEIAAVLSPHWPPQGTVAVETCPVLTSGLKRKLQQVSFDVQTLEATRDTLQHIVSATHLVDLSKKLDNKNDQELRALLACVQLTNVPGQLVLHNTVLRVGLQDVSYRRLAIHPALKFAENRLGERHVQCLELAMLGLESVSHFDFSDCQVSLTNLQRLLDAMPGHSVQRLVLNGIRLMQDTGTQLVKLSHLRKLRCLLLERTCLRDVHMEHLGGQLQVLPYLQELSLSSNSITTTGLSRLAPSLTSRSTLRVLRLSECALDVGSAFVIGCILTKSHDLHIINLNSCRLEDSGLQHLTNILKDKLRLTKVSMWRGGYSTQGLLPLLTHLSLCHNMQFLELGACRLVDDMADLGGKLVATLAESNAWDYLGLWQCGLGKSRHFLQGLSGLRTQLRGLTQLVLQENQLNDDSMQLLADAIRQGVFKFLQHLNLVQNDITQRGATSLADVLHCLPRLQKLLLQHSMISREGGIHLACATLRLPDMTFLDLSESSNMTSDDAIDILEDIARVAELIVVGEGVSAVPVEGEEDVFMAWNVEERKTLIPADILPEKAVQQGEGASMTAVTELPSENEGISQLHSHRSATVNNYSGEVVVDDKFHIKISRSFF